MNYLSVCSGIEAATCAWHPLGWHPAGSRYKAIGNSMAVPVMHWIGKRIQEVATR